jgi:hypothetical protein
MIKQINQTPNEKKATLSHRVADVLLAASAGVTFQVKSAGMQPNKQQQQRQETLKLVERFYTSIRSHPVGSLAETIWKLGFQVQT